MSDRTSSDRGAGDGEVLGGRYQLVRELGRGGMGAVYEARHVDLGRRFAVKVMRDMDDRTEEALARFRHEGEIAASVEHEHIAAALDFGHDAAGHPYIVIEYVEGESLATRLARESRLPVRDTLEIGRQLCSALDALHERGVVHRDIKPANVMLKSFPDQRIHVKLLDFGVAKLNQAPTLTASGVPVGTAAYMAPEQIRGKVDVRSDVYGVGALLYHCLAGRLTHTADDVQVMFYRVLHEPPAPLLELRAELPRAVAELVHRCLEKEAENRPQSARALCDRLLSLLSPGEPAPPELERTALGAAPVGAVAQDSGPVATDAKVSFVSQPGDSKVNTPGSRRAVALGALGLIGVAAVGFAVGFRSDDPDPTLAQSAELPVEAPEAASARPEPSARAMTSASATSASSGVAVTVMSASPEPKRTVTRQNPKRTEPAPTTLPPPAAKSEPEPRSGIVIPTDNPYAD